MLKEKKIKRYKFNQVVFTPDERNQLKYEGKAIHLPPTLSTLLVLLVENPGITITKDEILQAVWKTTKRTDDIITTTISELRQYLPKSCTISVVPRKGYTFDHKVAVEQVKLEKLEYWFAHTPGLKKYLDALIMVIIAFTLYAGNLLVTSLYYGLNPPPRHEVENTDPIFTRDYSAKRPRLSPNGRFIAHVLSIDSFANTHIGLYDAQKRDTRPIAAIGRADGYKWNLTGDKIIYQKTITGKCEIRLLSFHDKDKTQHTDERLGYCAPKSGQLSFAWFNDNEFYANFVVEGAKPTSNNFPYHHLYSYNIKTKRKKPIKKADFQDDFGFYSLEYDPVTKRLYFLQVNNFESTDVYQYDGKNITKIATVDQYIKFFTVHNNKLIYKNKQGHFVINHPAHDFNNPQELLRAYAEPLAYPHLVSDKLVYLAGKTSTASLYQKPLNQDADQPIAEKQLTEISTNGFNPDNLTSYNNQLIFSAKSTGVTQVYMQVNNTIKQISTMQYNQDIIHLDIAKDIVAISYDSRVDLYHLKNQQLAFIKSLEGYNRGQIHHSGKTLLLASTKGKDTSSIVELNIDDLTPTGRQVSEIQLAFYHNNDIIYLDNDRELIRISENGQKTITNQVNIDGLQYTDVAGNHLYYIHWMDPNRPLMKLDLITGHKSQIPLEDIKPSRVHIMSNTMVIRTVKPLIPSIVVGDLVLYE